MAGRKAYLPITQLLLTVFVFLVSRKFHSTWGIPGTEVSGTWMEQKYEQGRGWEWYDEYI